MMNMTAVADIVTIYIQEQHSHRGASLQNWEVASPLAPGNATVVWGLVWSSSCAEARPVHFADERGLNAL